MVQVYSRLPVLAQKSHFLGNTSVPGKPRGIVGYPITSISLILLWGLHSRREYWLQFIHKYSQLPILAVVQRLVEISSGPGGIAGVCPSGTSMN